MLLLEAIVRRNGSTHYSLNAAHGEPGNFANGLRYRRYRARPMMYAAPADKKMRVIMTSNVLGMLLMEEV